MAKYTESKCRLCRREGAKLFLKGERCFKGVCAFEKRPVAPGQHGAGRHKVSEYGQQLREKQKTKRIYGVLENQFREYFEKADRMKGITGENMLSLLERRLDNVVYRLGFAPSRTTSRQLVTHAHFTVNGKKVDIASYQLNVGDVVAVKENKRDSKYFEAFKQSEKSHNVPKWLEFDAEKLEGKVIALPTREDIDSQIQEYMIVELYSR